MNVHARKMAARQAAQYRDFKAYLAGVNEGGSSPDSLEYTVKKAWVEAMETVWERQLRQDPLKGELFDRLFGLSEPLRRRHLVLRLSRHFCCSPSCIYHWREQLLDTLIAAAVKTGAMEDREENAIGDFVPHTPTKG